MDPNNDLLTYFNNYMPSEIENYLAIPQDLNLLAQSPINEINKNLKPFSSFLKLAHIQRPR